MSIRKFSPLPDNLYGFRQANGHAVRPDAALGQQGTHLAFHFADKYSAAAGRGPGLDISDAIAQHPGPFKVKIQLGGGLDNGPGLWLAALAILAVFFYHCLGMVEAIIFAVNKLAAAVQLRVNGLRYPREGVFAEKTLGDAGLVGDDNQPVAQFLEFLQCSGHAGKDFHLGRRERGVHNAVLGEIDQFVDDAVAAQKYSLHDLALISKDLEHARVSSPKRVANPPATITACSMDLTDACSFPIRTGYLFPRKLDVAILIYVQVMSLTYQNHRVAILHATA